jgi:hypothetical protein
MITPSYGAGFAAVICFMLVFERLRVSAVSRRALQTAIDISKILRNAAATDDEKERAARAASLELLRCFGSITVRSAAALVASLLLLLFLQAFGLARISEVNRLMLSWQGILVAVAAAMVVYFAKGRV